MPRTFCPPPEKKTQKKKKLQYGEGFPLIRGQRNVKALGISGRPLQGKEDLSTKKGKGSKFIDNHLLLGNGGFLLRPFRSWEGGGPLPGGKDSASEKGWSHILFRGKGENL